ncbi:hypothetical protein EMIT0P228_100214 [Pseudomonas brassicacearum]
MYKFCGQFLVRIFGQVAEPALADAARGRARLTCASSTDRPLDYADINQRAEHVRTTLPVHRNP